MITQWGIVSTFLVLVLTFYARKKLGYIVPLTAALLILNGIFLIFFPHWQRYPTTPIPILKALHNNVAVSTLIVTLCSVTLYAIPKRAITKAFHLIAPLTLLNALIVILCQMLGITLEGNPGPSGFSYWSSFCDYSGQNGCFIALATPTVFRRFGHGAGIFCVLAIIYSGAVAPYMVLGFSSLAALVWQKPRALQFTTITLALLCPLLGFVPFSGRIEFYIAFMSTWLDRGYYLLGMGPGSLQFWNKPILREHDLLTNTAVQVPWLHSDWLQLLFEYGLLGLIPFIILFCLALRRFWKSNTDAWSILLGLSATAMFNYPMRYAWGAFLLTVLVGMYASNAKPIPTQSR